MLSDSDFDVKPVTPRLNGKVERSHLTDQREFYQVLDYTGDVILWKKLAQWEDYYNFLKSLRQFKGADPVPQGQSPLQVTCMGNRG